MDVREKLVELLCEAQHIITNTSKAKYLIEQGVTVQEWISVKDRLPENDTRVLVYLNIKKLDANTYTFFDTDRMLDGKWIRWNSYITHWMPLPQPPKGE